MAWSLVLSVIVTVTSVTPTKVTESSADLPSQMKLTTVPSTAEPVTVRTLLPSVNRMV